MSSHKSEIFVQMPGGGHAFITGVTDQCYHDYIDTYMVTKSGKEIFWYTYRQWAHLPNIDRNRLISELHFYGDKSDDPIVFASAQCSKCKKCNNPSYGDD